MSLICLLLVSWCGAVSLQHISTASDPDIESFERSYYQTHPYNNYLGDGRYGTFANIDDNDFYRTQDGSPEIVSDDKHNIREENANGVVFYNTDDREREAPAVKEFDNSRIRRWIRNMVDVDKTMYITADEKDQNSSPFSVDALQESTKHTKTKRNFSPWGGKRSPKTNNRFYDFTRTWTWKRAQSRDPNMPKRVRFSPWGGKRSGNIISKTTKSPKIIYTALVPQLWLKRSNTMRSENEDYSADGDGPLLLKGTGKKRYPFQLLKYKKNDHDRFGNHRYYHFMDPTGLNTIEGSPKKDGKRKVKFSAWGGKRSPIVGTMWAPHDQSRDDMLSTFFKDDDEHNERPTH